MTFAKLPAHCEYLVAGAGVSGLSLAHDLNKQGMDVWVMDKGDAPGGCSQSVQQDGFLFEKGPFNLLVRNPLFEELIASLGDSLEVTPPAPTAKIRELVINGVRQKVPMSLGDAIKTPILTIGQKMRVLAEPIAGKRPTSADPTLGDLVRRRFGDAVADRIVSAIIAGVYGGDSDLLSAKACFKILWEVDQSSSSLLFGFIKRAFGGGKRHKRRWKGMVSFNGGVGSFCNAIAGSLGGKIALETEIKSISRNASGYTLEVASATGETKTITASNLILATDLPSAVKLLKPWAANLAEIIAPIQSVSLAVVNLGFPKDAFSSPPEGFGFLIPKVEIQHTPILGGLFASSVFPQQAPEGCHSIRVFVGGLRSPEWVSLSPAELADKAIRELSKFIGIRKPPISTYVTQWPEAVPQMVPGHVERIENLEKQLEGYPGLTFVGNYLRGVSVNDCIVNSRETAARLIEKARQGA